MPQRFLRPGIRTSPRWNAVSHTAARLYIAILTQVDDYGRYDGRDSVLWSEAFAVWNEQNPALAVNPQESAALSCELSASKLLFFYEHDGRKYLQLTQWEERARGKSKWPDPKNSKILRNPAESCGILPPQPSPSPSPSPAPSVPQGAAAGYAPKIEHAEKWLANWKKNGADYTLKEMQSAFLALSASGWMWGKNPVVDFRAALERQIQTDRTKNNYGTKSSIKPNPRNFGVVGNLAENARRTAEFVKRKQAERNAKDEAV